ncbi:HAD family hydrolase [Cellulomonas biazotea]|uniref:Haloacid dehalogenase n=1 Tax=Cellulomonas biazotea TaxID=1709 RepID=A0A402DQB3_9CELL|nr:HAD family phosphatase [Cellulomonas biazotea]GCE76317.1 haloacid dehalogenase [Cellulomonas biazotea]
MATARTARTAADLRPGPQHRGLLLDHDGTLVDSQAVNYRALRDALAGTGIVLDQDWYDARTGVSTTEMVERLGVLHGVPVDAAAVTARRNAAYLARVHEVGEHPAVADLLRSTRGTLRAAVATGGQRETVVPTLEALGLLGLLDAVVTRDDVSAGKPSPEIFVLAAQRLGVEPGACLVLEDSDEGLAAALAAGMDAVDVRPLRDAG